MLINSTFHIDQVQNVLAGAWACALAHYSIDANVIPPMQNGSIGEMPVRLRRPHNGGVAPGCVVWRDSELRVVAIAGAREPADQLRAIDGYGHPVTYPTIPGKYNAYCITWLDSVANFIAADVAASDVPTWFFGFSWGSGPAVMLTKLHRMATPRRRAHCITFGSPRWCDWQAADQFNGVCDARIFNRTDPLPFIIPSLSEAPFAYAAIGPFAALQWQRFRHVYGGIGITDNGVFTPMALPDMVPLPLDLNIVDFVRINLGEGRPHSIMTYLRIMEYRNSLVPLEVSDPGVTIDERAGGHSPIEPRGKETTMREITNSARSVIHNREVQIANPQAAADRRRNRKIITIQKRQGMWAVYVADERVYMATSKRDAQGVANALRSLAIQLQQQPELWCRNDIVEMISAAQEAGA
jgi:hypothetical protein